MLVSISGLTKYFGEKIILKEADIVIEDNDRIGLVGINGAGKSTLLHIICNKLGFEDGEIFRKSGIRIGFLEQNSGLDKSNTLIEEMHGVYADIIHMGDKLSRLEAVMSNHEDLDPGKYERVSKEYALLQENFDKKGGYTFEINIKAILNGMGFGDKDYNMPVAALSGGEKTRLALAKLLLEQPELLILDEPTNHLDFDTLLWLENYLLEYKGAILAVSHDRYFLDKIANRIWEISNAKVAAYKGNYSKYKILKQERLQYQLKQYEAQQIEIADMKEYIEKNIARASTANSAKGRIKALERMEIIEKPIIYTKTAKLAFTFSRNPVKDVLQVSGIELAVGEASNKTILADKIDFELKRGEKIAIIGANGIGKSTFLKTILGKAEHTHGKVLWGDNVTRSYYEQENLSLNYEKTALDELWDRFPREDESKVRGNLARVLLTGDHVFKKISVLSGGERAKLVFAILLMEKSNTLILDEPTNHLDIDTKEILEDSLNEYEGTMLFVSHDRYLLNKIPTKIAELTKDGFILYNGNYDDYLENRLPDVEKGKDADSLPNPDEKLYVSKKQQRSEEAKRRSRIKQLEDHILINEEKISVLDQAIAFPKDPSDYTAMAGLCEELERLKTEIERDTNEWILLTEE